MGFMLKYVGLAIVSACVIAACVGCHELHVAKARVAQDKLRRDYRLQRSKKVRNTMGAMRKMVRPGMARSSTMGDAGMKKGIELMGQMGKGAKKSKELV